MANIDVNQVLFIVLKSTFDVYFTTLLSLNPLLMSISMLFHRKTYFDVSFTTLLSHDLLLMSISLLFILYFVFDAHFTNLMYYYLILYLFYYCCLSLLFCLISCLWCLFHCFSVFDGFDVYFTTLRLIVLIFQKLQIFIILLVKLMAYFDK